VRDLLGEVNQAAICEKTSLLRKTVVGELTIASYVRLRREPFFNITAPAVVPTPATTAGYAVFRQPLRGALCGSARDSVSAIGLSAAASVLFSTAITKRYP
jgi:hypothetical protein